MSDALTHSRGDATAAHPISGESPGIAEILERRTAAELSPDPTQATETTEQELEPQDDAAAAAAELASWRNRATEAEARAAEEARRRQQAEAARAEAVRGAEETGYTAITTALASSRREQEALQSEMKQAGEMGDFGKVAEIATRLGQLGAETRELERGQSEFERNRGERLQAPPQPTRQEPMAGSAVERAILGRLGATSREAFLASRTPDTAAFLHRNPSFFTDEAAFTRMIGAEATARASGVPIDSPEYFRAIEQGMRPVSQPPTTRQAVPGAPPSRESPGPTGRTRGGDVYVTAEQKAAAAWTGVDPVEYAREEARLRASGEIPYRRR